ncbi:MAG: hypothetical protein JWQ18_3259 [Conexibacter sp.]|nr:hypothetical protein [Conexibacter sp.]
MGAVEALEMHGNLRLQSPPAAAARQEPTVPAGRDPRRGREPRGARGQGGREVRTHPARRPSLTLRSSLMRLAFTGRFAVSPDPTGPAATIAPR